MLPIIAAVLGLSSKSVRRKRPGFCRFFHGLTNALLGSRRIPAPCPEAKGKQSDGFFVVHAYLAEGKGFGTNRWAPGGGALILQGAKPVRLAAGAFLLCVQKEPKYRQGGPGFPLDNPS